MSTRFIYNIIFFTSINSFVAQEDSALNVKPIFGTEFIEVRGPVDSDTIETERKLKIVYSQSNCNIVCYDSTSNIKWKIDLKKRGCVFGRFLEISTTAKQGIKNCDIIILKDNETTFGLNSEKGNLKKISTNYLKRKIAKFGKKK